MQGILIFGFFIILMQLTLLIRALDPPTSLVRDDELTDTTKVVFSWTAPAYDFDSELSYIVELKENF